MKQILAYDIQYEAPPRVAAKQPKFFQINYPQGTPDSHIQDTVADVISDKTGWTILGTTWHIIGGETKDKYAAEAIKALKAGQVETLEGPEQ